MTRSHAFCVSFRHAWIALALLLLMSAHLSAQRTLLGLECEQFQFPGGWMSPGTSGDNSGSSFLFAGEGAEFPAATAIEIPKAGQYTLWARAIDFPNASPGARNFIVSIGGKANSKPLGRTGKAGWNWERGDIFTLPKGPVLITIADNDGLHFGRVDALILCDDPKFVPTGKLDAYMVFPTSPLTIKTSEKDSLVPISPAEIGGAQVSLGQLENEHLRVGFIAAQRAGKASACPVLELKSATGWNKIPLDASAESYQVMPAAANINLSFQGFYPNWTTSQKKGFEIQVGGVKVKTASGARSVVWGAGQGEEAIVQRVTQLTPERLQLDFYPVPAGKLQATWELKPGAKTVRVEMTFTPAANGQYSLGYFLFSRKPVAEVDQMLLPFMVMGKRFPQTAYTMLQANCPTPVSLMQTGGTKSPLTLGVAADPADITYEFPVPIKSRFGLHIRNADGLVQPSIYGPLVGTPTANATAGQPVKFAFHIVAEPGEWYAGYRTVADNIFGWRDYRVNGAVSLTDAALNMIDLYMDDVHGGWWDRAKAPYQIESKNGSTQSSPLTAVSLYRLTGDYDLYKRRTVPSLEFMLSRDGSHFSPIPENTGSYPKGSMDGPVKLYGTTTYGGLWEIMNHRTSVFRDIALPAGDVRPTAGYSHGQSFEEWMARYQFTGEKAALEQAIKLADEYIQKEINTPPTEDLGPSPFFLIQYTPAWEGLLRMYEVTQEKRFLDAAVKGAHTVMTGMWTQPTPVMDNITIHPKGYVHGDLMDRKFHKGADEFRLGWPRKEGDTPEHQVPGWVVSNVGLGFEQPTTYVIKDNGGRMIFQLPWTSSFLRLARYTGDKQFETYARNAVIGRWSNYPGYYITTFTDLMQNPRYPYDGPDMGFIYYHHILVHLSWTIDYIVSEAALRSQGAIDFPALRQFGYAYFDNLVYGHAPGSIFGEKGAWLWFVKDLVKLDNSQINYLTAHSKDKFYVILMNESNKAEKVNVTFNPAKISKGAGQFSQARIVGDKGGTVALANNAGQVTVEPRGLVVLAIDGLEIEVPAHQQFAQPKPATEPGFVKATGNGIEARAAAIQIEPGPWQAYIWSTADSGKLKEISLAWTAGDKTGTIKDVDYPYEFSVPVAAGQTAFKFKVSGVKADGSAFEIAEKTIGVGE
jgi:hypothetical protein